MSQIYTAASYKIGFMDEYEFFKVEIDIGGLKLISKQIGLTTIRLYPDWKFRFTVIGDNSYIALIHGN